MHLFAPPQDVTSCTQHNLLDLVTTTFGKEKNHDPPYVSTGFHHGVNEIFTLLGRYTVENGSYY
jgi:hypothetical protein